MGGDEIRLDTLEWLVDNLRYIAMTKEFSNTFRDTDVHTPVDQSCPRIIIRKFSDYRSLQVFPDE
jgi:hypothetical protein